MEHRWKSVSPYPDSTRRTSVPLCEELLQNDIAHLSDAIRTIIRRKAQELANDDEAIRLAMERQKEAEEECALTASLSPEERTVSVAMLKEASTAFACTVGTHEAVRTLLTPLFERRGRLRQKLQRIRGQRRTYPWN